MYMKNRTSAPGRLLALLMAALMLVSVFPAGTFTVWAEGPYTVSVSTVGAGTVTLNGVETDSVSVEENETVALAVTPAYGFRISAISVNGATREISDYSSYTETLVVTENLSIDVTFLTLGPVSCTVSASKTGMGTILLDGIETDSITKLESESVSIDATPAAKYAVNAVLYNGVAQTVSDPAHYSDYVTITGDLAVAVEFIKTVPEYTLSVTKSGSGSVLLNGSPADSVTVDADEADVNVTVVPATGWEIQSIVLDGTELTLTDAEKDHYDTTLHLTANSDLQVTFGKKNFQVSAGASANGEISFQYNDAAVEAPFSVPYSDPVRIKFTPNSGYNVTNIQINGSDPSAYGAVFENDGSAVICTVSVTENMVVSATFGEGSVGWSNVSFTGGFLPVVSVPEEDPQQLIYVYPKTVSAVQFDFSTDGSVTNKRIWINGTETSKLTTSTVVSSIRYSFKRFGQTFEGEIQLPVPELIFVLDQTSPTVSIPEEYVDGCAASDVTIPFTVLDPDWLTQEDQEQEEYNTHTGSGVRQVIFNLRASETMDFSLSTTNQQIQQLADSSDRKKSEVFDLELSLSDYEGKFVQVEAVASDWAGNTKTETFVIAFNSVDPVITNFTYTSSDPHVSYNGRDYFPEGRTALISIQESPLSFEMTGVSLVGSAIDSQGYSVTLPLNVFDWSHSTDSDGNSIYVGTVRFSDAIYTLNAIRYTNKAGRTAVYSLVSSAYINRFFTVDRGAPTGKVIVTPKNESESLGTWDKLLDSLTFGLWSKKTVTITAEPTDEVGEIADCSFYLSDQNTPKTAEQLDALDASDWTSFDWTVGYDVPANRRFVCYLRITDGAGHRTYLSTDSVVVDDAAPTVTVKPQAGYGEQSVYGIDGGDKITVDVTIDEKSPYSGLKLVDYWIDNFDERVTMLDVSYDTPPAFDDLITGKTFSIELPKADYNRSDVQFTARAVDNAGNAEVRTVTLDIDVTKPTVDVTFDAVQNPGAEEGCFSAVTAIIKVTERTCHFDPSEAGSMINIDATDSQGNSLPVSWTASGWVTEEGATPDEAVHTLRITFADDGNYKLTAQFRDLAGNVSDVFQKTFTLDAHAPTGTVTAAGKGTWTSLKDTLSFGLWCKDEVLLTATAEDFISDTVDIAYYLNEGGAVLDEAALAALDDAAWKPFPASLSVPANSLFTVYLRLRDKAGNVSYLNSDGLVADNEAAQIALTPSPANANGIYGLNDPAVVSVQISDNCSGIRSVEYWITSLGTETVRETLFDFDYTRDPGDDANGGQLTVTELGQTVFADKGIYPSADQLRKNWTGSITVDKYLNNSCSVEVFVQVTDNSGNVSVSSVKLDIDSSEPEIYLYYDNNSPYKIVSDRGYYPAERTATLVVVERNHHFSAEDLRNGIVITAVDAAGKPVLTNAQIQAMIGSWTYYPGETADGDRHIAEIHYSADANYTFSVTYADKAGNPAMLQTIPSVTPLAFTVDKTKPTATVEAVGIRNWSDLIVNLTFQLFSAHSVTYAGTWDDATSPIESVSWYRSSANSAMTVSQLDAVTTWQPFNGLSVAPDARVTLYLRVVDYAGNVFYVSTDGIIIDNTPPAVVNATPRVTVSPAQPVNGLYNRDVPVRVTVEDPIVNGSWSGLNEIRYEVHNMGTLTQSGTLYSYTGTAHSQNDLLQIWDNANAIVIDSARNNSNNVVVTVYAVDNAGNKGSGQAELRIDVTPPKISVSYDNNNGDTAFADAASGAYFNAPRTATIVVTERNFEPAAVTLSLTNSDGSLPVLSAWRTEGGTGNGDNTRHIATLTYTADGTYSFDLFCTDRAGNQSDPVEYTGLSPQRFTIDRTAPLIEVRYDPDDSHASYERYFNRIRTATITVTERNFETSRLNLKLTATDHGADVPAPTLSEWRTTGDVHVATIVYEADADYSFDLDYRDKAGNAAADYPGDSFVVDQTPPAVELKGIEDQSANSTRGDIGFSISATDTNLADFTPVLTGIFYEDDTFVTRTIDLGEPVADGDTLTYTVRNLPDDGVYYVTCVAEDKAGNSYENYTLYRDGSPYTVSASADHRMIEFSVNRKGSVYALNESTQALVDHYYVQRVREDLVLIEINADELAEHTVTLNGKTLTEGTDYTVTCEQSDGGWYRYVYKVNPALFEEEGAYNVVVSSLDKAGNNTYSDVKGVSVKFVVDRTAPVVTVSGMETDGRYRTDLQTVTLVPTDDGGALRSLSALLVDEDGVVLKELISLEGEALEQALEAGEGKLTFTLSEGLYQNVRIVCDDWADYTGEENILYDHTFTNVSVSKNVLSLFWANKPLRWGTIGGVGGLGAVGLLLALLKKRKKKETAVKKA